MRRSKNPAIEVPFVRSKDGTFSFGPYKRVPAIDKYYQKGEEGYSNKKIAACFLGNKAENRDILIKCLFDAIYRTCEGRKLFRPEDPTPVTPIVEASREFQETVGHIEEASAQLVDFLNSYSLPFYSMRYQGHMNWDTTLPSAIGYLIAMLYNPNNVSIQGSTATTLLERIVGLDICGMIGFDLTGGTKPWAHITCDGTVANMESVWSTRELKFLPLAVQDSLHKGEAFEKVNDLTAKMPDGSHQKILEMDTWELINLTCDEILKIPGEIAKKLAEGSGQEDKRAMDESEVWEALMHRYSLGARGFLAFAERLAKDGVKSPVVIVPSSKHYSWPKSTSVLGMGYESKLFEEKDASSKGLLNVPVDADARIDKDKLSDVLDDCFRSKIPVLQVVAVMGSTEESAVDPLDEIIDLREKCRKEKLMDFNVHADAAWGGYLLSALRKPYLMPVSIDELPIAEQTELAEDGTFDTKGVLLSDYTLQNMMAIRKCDSVTIDPHKWGYVPYPAGSLSYRNGTIVNLVTFGAPYIGSSTGEAAKNLSMGESGIEGSKPGATAAAVFLSHQVLRPDRNGYGQLMQGALFNAKIFFLHLLRIGVDFERRRVDFKPYILKQKALSHGFWSDDIIQQFMNHEIDDRDFVQELSSKDNLDLIRAIGPDQSTLAYAFNKRGNRDLESANRLNSGIFNELYPNPTTESDPIPINKFDMFVTMTTFIGDEYGEMFMRDFAGGLGVDLPDPKTSEIKCLRSVVMDPWMANTLDTSEDFIGITLIPALLNAAKRVDEGPVIKECMDGDV